MQNHICSLSSPKTYGHLALIASITSVTVATALFFSIDLGVLPTALIGGVGGGGCLILAAAFYSCGCKRSSRSYQRGNNQPYEQVTATGYEYDSKKTGRSQGHAQDGRDVFGFVPFSNDQGRAWNAGTGTSRPSLVCRSPYSQTGGYPTTTISPASPPYRSEPYDNYGGAYMQGYDGRSYDSPSGGFDYTPSSERDRYASEAFSEDDEPIKSRMSTKEVNRAIFESTLERCRGLDAAVMMESYQSKDEVYTATNTRPIRKMSQMEPHDTTFQVRIPDAIVEALKIIAADNESLPLVLNMADPEKVGGGVDGGSSTEEALLCRCTTLYPKLERAAKKTRLPREGGIYFDKVKIIKDSKGAELRFPEEIAVINVAAFREKDPEKIKTNIRLMLRQAFWKGHTHLILGDYGCVTFGNNPNTVAQCFKDVFEEKEFQNVFEEVIFAIPDDHVGRTFATVLQPLTKKK